MYVNLIILYNHDKSCVLMAPRMKDPFKNKLNFIGGKKETTETMLASAYREMYEEANISADQTSLKPLVTLFFEHDQTTLSVFTGIISEELPLINDLIWIDVASDFNDLSVFAGYREINFLLTLEKALNG